LDVMKALTISASTKLPPNWLGRNHQHKLDLLAAGMERVTQLSTRFGG
jgi:hypothetical protein